MKININTTVPFVAVFAVICAFAAPAGATPMPLTFTYPYETLPAGSAEVEQYVDATYVRIPRDDASAASGTTIGPRYRLQTELEYGITDRLELGLYMVFAQDAAPGPTLKFDGVKERLRLRLGEGEAGRSTSGSTSSSRSSTTSSRSKRKSSSRAVSESYA